MKFLLYVSGRPDLSCPKVGSRYPPDKSLSSAAWTVQEVSPLLIRWIVIYPVDSAIQLSNKRDLRDSFFLRFTSESQVKFQRPTKTTFLLFIFVRSIGTRSGMPEQHSKLRKQDFSKLKNPNKNYTFTFRRKYLAICELTAWLAGFSRKPSTVILWLAMICKIGLREPQISIAMERR